MTITVRTRILLFFGAVAVVVVSSSTAFSQAPCFTVSASEIAAPAKGLKIMSVKAEGGKVVAEICVDNTANTSPSQQPTAATTPVDECTRQQQARQAAEAEALKKRQDDEDARKRREAERIERLAGKEAKDPGWERHP
jgi:hypothetical protein